MKSHPNMNSEHPYPSKLHGRSQPYPQSLFVRRLYSSCRTKRRTTSRGKSVKFEIGEVGRNIPTTAHSQAGVWRASGTLNTSDSEYRIHQVSWAIVLAHFFTPLYYVRNRGCKRNLRHYLVEDS